MRIDVNPAKQRRLKLLPQPPLSNEPFMVTSGMCAEHCGAPRPSTPTLAVQAQGLSIAEGENE